MNNSKLKFGLNVKPTFSMPKRRPNALFEDDLDSTPSSEIIKPSRELPKEPSTKVEEIDPIFDYDAFNETKALAQLQRKKAKDGIDGATKKPRYMETLIASSLKRKIEQERVDERKVQKERELEGNLYGDKESFVTEAYLAKQAELAALEASEKRECILISKVASTSNMDGFYRNLLDAREKESFASLVTGELTGTEAQEELELDQLQAEHIQQAIGSGRVQLNDSNELVDKRQLLSGGLNVTIKGLKRQETQVLEKEREKSLAHRDALLREQDTRKKAMLQQSQARQRASMMAQQEQVSASKSMESDQERVKFQASLASQIKPETVLDAKARFLARQRQKESQ